MINTLVQALKPQTYKKITTWKVSEVNKGREMRSVQSGLCKRGQREKVQCQKIHQKLIHKCKVTNQQWE